MLGLWECIAISNYSFWKGDYGHQIFSDSVFLGYGTENNSKVYQRSSSLLGELGMRLALKRLDDLILLPH